MPASSHRTEPTVSSPPAELHFSAWPLRDEGVAPWLLLTVSAALAIAGGYISRSLPLGLMCLAALWISLWRVWLPVRYDLGPRGVVETVLGRRHRIGWTQVARYEIRRRGVLLLATHESTPLRTLQALYVPWGRRQTEVLEIVRFYLDRSSSAK